MLGLRAVALVLCGALYTAAVDPDQVLRLFRRLSFHSALTATLATRMVPVLARDARRLADAQRCRPGPPPSRARLVRAATAGVLDRALDVAAALEVRGYGAARRAPRSAGPHRPWSRHDLAFAASAVAIAALAVGGRVAGLVPFSSDPVAARAGARAAAWPWRSGCWSARCSRSRTAGGSSDERAVAFDHVTYTYPGAAAPALADVTLEVAPGELVVLAGGSGSGKSTLLRAANGLVPHFHGGAVRRSRASWPGMDTRDHGPAQLAAAVGTLFQDPETQVVMGTVRAELALPAREPGRGGGRGGARGRGGGARARDRASARPPDRRAVGRRAPAGRARAPRWSDGPS